MRRWILIGLVAVQLVLPAAGFSGGAALRLGLAAPPRACASIVSRQSLPLPARNTGSRTAALQLQASVSLTTAADPEAAWTQSGTGDNALLASIVPSLKVLTPGTGNEVTVGELVGSGKGLVVFMRHIGCPFCWELASNVNKILPQLQAAGVTVMVCTVASPTKAADFVEAQAELPLSVVFCSSNLDAYRALGFYDNFGAALGARNAGLLPLEKIRARGEQGLKDMADSVKNIAKVSPIGLVSGKTFSLEDAKAATQLGGALAFDGGKVVFAHRDRAVADHVDLSQALAALGVAAA